MSECITQLSSNHATIITTLSQHYNHDCTWRWARRRCRWRGAAVGARRRCRWRRPAVGTRRRRRRTTVSAWLRHVCCRRRVTSLSRGSSRVARRWRSGWRCLGAHRNCKTDRTSGKAGHRSRAASAAAASARDSCRPEASATPITQLAVQLHSRKAGSFATHLVHKFPRNLVRKKSASTCLHIVTRDTRSCPFPGVPLELWCRGSTATHAAPAMLPALALRHQLRGQLLGQHVADRLDTGVSRQEGAGREVEVGAGQGRCRCRLSGSGSSSSGHTKTSSSSAGNDETSGGGGSSKTSSSGGDSGSSALLT